METEIEGTYEPTELSQEIVEPTSRRIVVPGETIVEGEDYLPGDGTRRVGSAIVASKFGLAEEAGRVVRILSIFGAFVPRRNNVVIGRIVDVTHSGWLVDIDCSTQGFIPIEESPRFVNRHEMDQFLAIGDVIAAKIWSVKPRGIDLSLKGPGLGRLEGGFIFHVIPSRVPRVIGKEGSMVSLIKEHSNCAITVGQNGWIWIRGDSLDDEIKARRAVEFVTDKVHTSGLTDKMQDWFAEYSQ